MCSCFESSTTPQMEVEIAQTLSPAAVLFQAWSTGEPKQTLRPESECFHGASEKPLQQPNTQVVNIDGKPVVCITLESFERCLRKWIEGPDALDAISLACQSCAVIVNSVDDATGSLSAASLRIVPLHNVDRLIQCTADPRLLDSWGQRVSIAAADAWQANLAAHKDDTGRLAGSNANVNLYSPTLRLRQASSSPSLQRSYSCLR